MHSNIDVVYVRNGISIYIVDFLFRKRLSRLNTGWLDEPFPPHEIVQPILKDAAVQDYYAVNSLKKNAIGPIFEFSLNCAKTIHLNIDLTSGRPLKHAKLLGTVSRFKSINIPTLY